MNSFYLKNNIEQMNIEQEHVPAEISIINHRNE